MKSFPNSLLGGKKGEFPLVPLKDIVVFPHMVVPFFVDRKRSVKAIEEAMNKGKILFITTQKNNKTNEPGEDDLCSYGTVSRILQMLKLPDGAVRVLVEGTVRAGIVKIIDDESYLKVQVKLIKDEKNINTHITALLVSVKREFSKYARRLKKIPPEIINLINKIDTPDRLVDTICANIPVRPDKKMELLSETNSDERIEGLLVLLKEENELLEIQMKIDSRVKKRIKKTQKNYYLNEQIKEIRKELGTGKEDVTGAVELEERLKDKKLPEDVLEKCMKEVKRLARLQPMSPESGILRTYLEWICDLPWSDFSEESKDIERAKDILDEDHYGLKKVKERILDFIAVRQLKMSKSKSDDEKEKVKVKGPILCFVGPPGTGKTSLGRSVARALGREFIRISLGGVRDEAEIRGHRKTYIGALPGKIISSMRKAGFNNPVFLLDEIDKMSADFRGDPAAALLEVLDPEQNVNFTDHYLEVTYDLSSVMFITTANSVHNIPYPLRDRMEMIEISGYSEYEKEKIASQFLIPKQIIENGMEWASVNFKKNAIKRIIEKYTMESGVRNLEREVANVLRKLAREAIKTESIEPDYKVTVTAKAIERYLGKPKYHENRMEKVSKPGLIYGLAWTEVGGLMLPVEVVLLKGKGELFLTGSLGDVMKESAQTAISFLRANADKDLEIPETFYEDKDIHIHVPEGAIPKDGPSAGITITTALYSAITGIPIKEMTAMTGEITLTGRILPIGGIREKVLAAHRNEIKNVLLPELNKRDIEELPKEVRSTIEFTFVKTIKEALSHLFPEKFC